MNSGFYKGFFPDLDFQIIISFIKFENQFWILQSKLSNVKIYLKKKKNVLAKTWEHISGERIALPDP